MGFLSTQHTRNMSLIKVVMVVLVGRLASVATARPEPTTTLVPRHMFRMPTEMFLLFRDQKTKNSMFNNFMNNMRTGSPTGSPSGSPSAHPTASPTSCVSGLEFAPNTDVPDALSLMQDYAGEYFLKPRPYNPIVFSNSDNTRHFYWYMQRGTTIGTFRAVSGASLETCATLENNDDVGCGPSMVSAEHSRSRPSHSYFLGSHFRSTPCSAIPSDR